MKERTLIIKVSIPAGTDANRILTARLNADPKTGDQDFIQIPKGKVWVIDDIYVISSPSIDVILYFYKNDEKLMTSTPPVSTLQVNNPARPMVEPFGYEEFSKMTVLAVNLAKNTGSEAVEVTVYAKVKEYDVEELVAPSPF